MKYIVTYCDTEGFEYKKSIEAIRVSINDTFVMFHNKGKVFRISKLSVISIASEGYELENIIEKPISKKEKNSKIIQLYGQRK